MKQYASFVMAKKYIEQFGQVVYVSPTDERGIIEFYLPTRHMMALRDSISDRLGLNPKFERTPHYIADTFELDPMRKIRLLQKFGTLKCVIQLIDDTEVDLGPLP